MRVGKADGSGWLRLNDAADLLGISHTTLRRWSDSGRLTCYRSPGGHRRYRRSDLAAALAAQGGAPSRSADHLSVRTPRRESESDQEHLLAARSATGALTTLTRVAAEGVGVDEATIAFADGHDLEILAGHWVRDSAAPRGLNQRCALDDAPAAAIALTSHRRLVIADLDATSVLSAREADLYRRAGRSALLVVPITVHGRPAGVLELAAACAPHTFTGANVAFAEFVAHQAASFVTEACGRDGAEASEGGIAGRRGHDRDLAPQQGDPTGVVGRSAHPVSARPGDLGDAEGAGPSSDEFVDRLRRRNRELDLIVQAGLRDIAGLKPEEVVRSIARRLSELTQTPVVDLYAVDGPLMRALTSFDGGRFDDDWEGVTLPLSRYPCSLRAVETREITVAAHLEDAFLSDQDRYSLEKWGYQAQLSMPLMAEGRIIGLVELSDYTPRDFAQDLELIRSLGAAATQAVQTITRLDQVERRDRIFKELVAVGSWASKERDLQKVFARAAERIVATVDAANCDIFALQDEAFTCLASHDRSGPDASSRGRRLDTDRYPALAASVRAGEAFVLRSDDDARLGEEERRLYREHGVASEVCVPLVANERLFGLIDVYDTREREFEEYLDFLHTMSDGLAGRMEAQARLEDLEQRGRVLQELAGMMALAGGSRTPQALLEMVATRLCEVLGVVRCDIYRLRGDRLSCSASVDEHGPDESALGFEFEIDEFPATAMAVRTGRPLAIGRLDEDARLTAHEREHYTSQGFVSEVCLPLAVDGRVTGIVDLFDSRPRDVAPLLLLLQPVADFIARALAQAVHVERAERRTAAVSELVELMAAGSAAGDATGLARAIEEHVTAHLGARGCRILNVRGGALRPAVVEGAGEDDPRWPLDLESLPRVRAAIQRRESLVITIPGDHHLSDHERRVFESIVPASHLCLPLVVRDRVVGLLDVFDAPGRDWAGSVDLLETVSVVVGATLENAFLLDALEESNRQLALLAEAGAEFSASLDLDHVLHAVATHLCAAASAPTCEIFVVADDRIRRAACIENGEPDPASIGTEYALNELALMGEALRSGLPVAVADVENDTRIPGDERAEDLERGRRAKLVLPLVSEGSVIGLACVVDDGPRQFDGLPLLKSLGQVAAAALVNATLYARLDRSAERLGLLSDVGFELSSSLRLDDVLLSTASRLCQVAKAARCDILRVEEEDLVLVASVCDGQPETADIGRSTSLAERPTAGEAIATLGPVLVESLDDALLTVAQRRVMYERGQTRLLTAPLVSKGRVIGVLELSGGDPSPGHLPGDAVDAVCRVAALAIDNAGLVQDLERRGRETALLNEIAAAAGAGLDLAKIAAASLGTLRHLVSFTRGMIAVLREDGRYECAYAVGAETGPDAPHCDTDTPEGLQERVLRERVVVFDVPHAAGGAGGFTSVLMAALVADDELIGTLRIESPGPGAFADEDRSLLSRVATQLALAMKNAALYARVSEVHHSNLRALSGALNAKDYYTLGHAARVAAYTALLGRELGWDRGFLRRVEEAAYLHDIGKIAVSDRVLLKPSSLNATEWELMRQHPIFSSQIIQPLFAEELVAGVRHHHERYDGEGYPDGLSGDDIPLLARVMCVVDSYDAMSLRRPYRLAHSYDECVEELRRCAGTHFDPHVVDAFLRVLAGLEETRERAKVAARGAAALVDPVPHETLRGPEDECTPAYSAVVAALRGVRDAHPPARFVTTLALRARRVVIVADAEEPESPERSCVGDEVPFDDDLDAAFNGRPLDSNTLYVDQFGIWVSAVEPIRDSDGATVAVASVDMPVETGDDMEGLRSEVSRAFSSMLASKAGHVVRAELEAAIDSLTGLYSHRYFHERLREEIGRCEQQRGTLAVLLLDVDDFKSFNDRHGHSAGDSALRTVARIVESSLDGVDVGARFGGQEFAAILLDADRGRAKEVADHIQRGIAAAECAGGDLLTVSTGIALWPEDAGTKDQLLDRAEKALRAAKRQRGGATLAGTTGRPETAPA